MTGLLSRENIETCAYAQSTDDKYSERVQLERNVRRRIQTWREETYRGSYRERVSRRARTLRALMTSTVSEFSWKETSEGGFKHGGRRTIALLNEEERSGRTHMPDVMYIEQEYSWMVLMSLEAADLERLNM
jgi:hypothetical protein